MSRSLSTPKFLLDENVKKRLLVFLKDEGYDAKYSEKGLRNGKLAAFSKSEQRVLITNDSDFISFTKKEIYGVIHLKIPQDKSKELISAFSLLLEEMQNFQGKIISLRESYWELIDLFEEHKL